MIEIAGTIMASMATTRPGVQERILLHLRDYIDYADKVEVPLRFLKWVLQMLSQLQDQMYPVQFLE